MVRPPGGSFILCAALSRGAPFRPVRGSPGEARFQAPVLVVVAAGDAVEGTKQAALAKTGVEEQLLECFEIIDRGLDITDQYFEG